MGLGIDPAAPNPPIEFVPVYTQTGGEKAVVEAVRKALFFDRCDMLSGLVSYRTMREVIPILTSMQKTGFFFDLGEYLPNDGMLSDNAFFNSHQLWQGQYALGRFAFESFGEDGFLIAPVYESGYHLSSAFSQGYNAAGGTRLNLYTLPFNEQNPHDINLDEIFARFRQDSPPYVHALFSGQQGVEFIQRWAQSEFADSVPLLVSDMMVQHDVLQDLAGLNLTLYAPSLWMRSAEDKRNVRFVKDFENKTQHPANIFALLGYEVGLMMREVQPQLKQRDWGALQQVFKTKSVRGPRGERNFYPQSGFALPTVDLLKIKLNGSLPQITVVNQGKGLIYSAEVFSKIHKESVSGWQNPYLCY